MFPQLYPLGPLEISDGEIVFTEARAWYVANDPLTIGVIGQTAFTQSATSPLALTGPTISASDLNPVLVVVVQTVPSTNAPTVTVDGVSMISAVTQTQTGAGNDQRSTIFYLTRSQGLPDGAGAISVSLGGTPTDIGAAAIALSGVQQGIGAGGNNRFAIGGGLSFPGLDPGFDGDVTIETNNLYGSVNSMFAVEAGSEMKLFNNTPGNSIGLTTTAITINAGGVSTIDASTTGGDITLQTTSGGETNVYSNNGTNMKTGNSAIETDANSIRLIGGGTDPNNNIKT